MVTEGIEFIEAKSEVIIDYLNSRELIKKEVDPTNLKVENEGKLLILQIMNGGIKEYPIRKTFLYKLLKWYQFPIHQLFRLSLDTITSICNDYLMNIKSDKVILKIENQEALTILSPKYNEISDIEIIKQVTGLGVRNISRNDFFMSITTEEKIKTRPLKDDDFGIGLNIINSETGFKALRISHHLLRYTCSNGAYTKIYSGSNNENFRYHYGNHDLKLFLKTNVEKAEEERNKIIDKLLLMTEINVTESKEYYIKKLEPILGKRDAINFFKDFNDQQTLYDIFNSITLKAKNYNFSKRYFLESFAGDMLLDL